MIPDWTAMVTKIIPNPGLYFVALSFLCPLCPLLYAEAFKESVVLGHLGLEIVDGDPASLERLLPCRQTRGVLVQRRRLKNK